MDIRLISPQYFVLCDLIELIARGDACNISMGLAPANNAPNRQAGWDPQSIGYHSNDGG